MRVNDAPTCPAVRRRVRLPTFIIPSLRLTVFFRGVFEEQGDERDAAAYCSTLHMIELCRFVSHSCYRSILNCGDLGVRNRKLLALFALA